MDNVLRSVLQIRILGRTVIIVVAVEECYNICSRLDI